MHLGNNKANKNIPRVKKIGTLDFRDYAPQSRMHIISWMDKFDKNLFFKNNTLKFVNIHCYFPLTFCSQVEVRDPKWNVQTGPDGKCLCPDRPRLKVPMSRPSQTECGYVQTIVHSKLFVRSSCVRWQICPDHRRPKRYMSRLSCVHVQIIVRSKSNLCVQRQNFSASMSRPSCVHVQTRNHFHYNGRILSNIFHSNPVYIFLKH